MGGQRGEGGGKGSIERGRAAIGKEGVALVPRKKIPAGIHASIINLLLNRLIWKASHRADSSLQISLRLYLILILRWRRTVFLIMLSSEEYRCTPTYNQQTMIS